MPFQFIGSYCRLSVNTDNFKRYVVLNIQQKIPFKFRLSGYVIVLMQKLHRLYWTNIPTVITFLFTKQASNFL